MHIVLTGAGFSRNWGGWLAEEAFEYLLGCHQTGAELRDLLWIDYRRGQSFEDTLGDLQEWVRTTPNAIAYSMLDALTGALGDMFDEMNKGLAAATLDEAPSLSEDVSTFLRRFDAIFTLNQDLLLEGLYSNDKAAFLQSGRRGWHAAGVRQLEPSTQLANTHQTQVPLQTPEGPPFATSPSVQPYFKLNGSSNLVRQPGGRLLIKGHTKTANVNEEPLFKWSFEQFVSCLNHGDTRLVVIGYGFRDRLINKALMDAAKTSGLKLFIVDPLGINVLNQRPVKPAFSKPDTLMDALSHSVLGASRRPLRSTFGSDQSEHAKLMKFMGVGGGA